MEEIFKDIPGYEWLYQVSNIGNVKSFNWRNKWITNIIKSFKNQKGYLRVSLSNNNKSNNFLVHRLILLSFVGNSKLEVNHKDWNKQNNTLDNLEYCTRGENVKHWHKIWLYRIRRWKDCHFSKKIWQYNIEWKLIKKWNYIWEVSILWKWFSIQNISCCLNWRQLTAWGYIWKYL